MSRSTSPTPQVPPSIALAGDLEMAKPLLSATLPPPATTSEQQPAADADVDADADADADDHALHPTPWLLVFCLAFFYFLFSGVENGVGPCVVTTLQEQFNASTTNIAAAQSMAEVAKIGASFSTGHYMAKAKVLFVCIGAVIWVGGCIVLGSTVNIAMLYVGFGIIGLGYNFLTVLTPPILEDALPTEKSKSRVPWLLGIIYANSAVGVAAGFLICGLTIDSVWRLDFFVAGACSGVPLLLLGRYVIADTCSSRDAVAEKMRESAKTDRELWPTLLFLSQKPVVAFTTLSATSQFFYISAFIALLPKYIEEGLNQSKSTASFVLAATVPAAVIGTLAGGYLCKRWRLSLRGQLTFCLATNGVVLPMLLIFLSDDFLTVVLILISSMFTVFMNASPTLTLLALAVEDEKLVSYANALFNVVTRAVGGIPGPIILGVLIDNATSSFTLADAYLCVGLSAGTLTVGFGAVALYYAIRREKETGGGGSGGTRRHAQSESDQVLMLPDHEEKSAAAAAMTQKKHRTAPPAASSNDNPFAATALALPVIHVILPSPARTESTGAGSPMTEEMREWVDGNKLKPPENTFLAPEGEEAEEEEAHQQQQQHPSAAPVAAAAAAAAAPAKKLDDLDDFL